MRIQDKNKITYNKYFYGDSDAISGVEVVEYLHEDKNKVFKTLVTIGTSKQYYVFVIPVAEELNLKKAAKVVGEKKIEMIKSKELLPVTGYIHGGCSPIGMKKQFKTVINDTAKNCDTIIFSAGKIGYQVEMSLQDLAKIIKYELADLIQIHFFHVRQWERLLEKVFIQRS